MTNKLIIKPNELLADQHTIHGKGAGSALKKERNVANASPTPNGKAPIRRTSPRKFSGKDALKKTARLDLVFLCSSCGKKLSAPMTAEGEHVPCPDCGSQLTVPEKDPDLDKKVGGDTPNTKKQSTFKFCCIRCGQSLEIERVAAGSKLECPNCKSTIDVPQPPDEWA